MRRRRGRRARVSSSLSPGRPAVEVVELPRAAELAARSWRRSRGASRSTRPRGTTPPVASARSLERAGRRTAAPRSRPRRRRPRRARRVDGLRERRAARDVRAVGDEQDHAARGRLAREHRRGDRDRVVERGSLPLGRSPACASAVSASSGADEKPVSWTGREPKATTATRSARGFDATNARAAARRPRAGALHRARTVDQRARSLFARRGCRRAGRRPACRPRAASARRSGEPVTTVSADVRVAARVDRADA